MGRVRTKTVKRSAKKVIELYYPRLTLDFDTNKRVCYPSLPPHAPIPGHLGTSSSDRGATPSPQPSQPLPCPSSPHSPSISLVPTRQSPSNPLWKSIVPHPPQICDEIAVIQSKRLRNKIAGYVTHLMKRIAQGPVRGISFKLQEEERERKDNYVPEVSAIEQDVIEVDPDTKAMLAAMDFGHLERVQENTQMGQPSAGGRYSDRKWKK